MRHNEFAVCARSRFDLRIYSACCGSLVGVAANIERATAGVVRVAVVVVVAVCGCTRAAAVARLGPRLAPRVQQLAPLEQVVVGGGGRNCYSYLCADPANLSGPKDNHITAPRHMS